MPIKQIRDRKTAVSRIWKAIQSLGDVAPAADEPKSLPESETAPVVAEGPEAEVPAPAAPHAPDAAPEEAPANNDANPATGAGRKAAPGPRTCVRRIVAGTARSEVGCSQERARYTETVGTPKVANPGTARGQPSAPVIGMLKRPDGVTLEAIMAETGWQQHTARALMIAGGTLTKRSDRHLHQGRERGAHVFPGQLNHERASSSAPPTQPRRLFSFRARFCLMVLRMERECPCRRTTMPTTHRAPDPGRDDRHPRPIQ